MIGLPDEDLGQRLHAIVQRRAEVSEQEMLDHMAERLIRYKIPRSIEIVDEPLRNEAGKMSRSALRAARLGKG